MAFDACETNRPVRRVRRLDAIHVYRQSGARRHVAVERLGVVASHAGDLAPARTSHAMTFDAGAVRSCVRWRIDHRELGDTWLWNGTTWTQPTTTVGPIARTARARVRRARSPVPCSSALDANRTRFSATPGVGMVRRGPKRCRRRRPRRARARRWRTTRQTGSRFSRRPRRLVEGAQRHLAWTDDVDTHHDA